MSESKTADHQADVKILLEIYRQTAADRRQLSRQVLATMVIFLVAVCVLLYFAYISTWAKEIIVTGAVLTVLCGFLAEQLVCLLDQEHKRLKGCEKLLGIIDYFMPDIETTNEVALHMVMRCFFVLVFCGWMTLFGYFYF